MNNRNPKSSGILFAENHHHIILMHDHEETEAIFPEYYKVFIDKTLEKGLKFVEPAFI